MTDESTVRPERTTTNDDTTDIKERERALDILVRNYPGMVYHCRDDEVVPFEHLALWARDLPRASVHALETGGHQFNNDLSSVAQDIASLIR